MIVCIEYGAIILTAIIGYSLTFLFPGKHYNSIITFDSS
jgi:hypothetical protein